jgi:single-strand DNA-binding protein
MYQKVILVGNLGRDPEMRYTPSGQTVTNMNVATSESWKDANGEKHERTLWWRVAVFGKMGEACNTYLKKGSKVLVEGRMIADEKGNPRTFTRQDGTAGTSFEVNAAAVKFLSSRAESGGGQPGGEMVEGDAAPAEEGEIPF